MPVGGKVHRERFTLEMALDLTREASLVFDQQQPHAGIVRAVRLLAIVPLADCRRPTLPGGSPRRWDTHHPPEASPCHLQVRYAGRLTQAGVER
jgi:hypothetical protein